MSAGGAGSLQSPSLTPAGKPARTTPAPLGHRVDLSVTRLSRYRTVETRGRIHDLTQGLPLRAGGRGPFRHGTVPLLRGGPPVRDGRREPGGSTW